MQLYHLLFGGDLQIFKFTYNMFLVFLLVRYKEKSVRLLFTHPSSLCDVSGPWGLPPSNTPHLLQVYVSLHLSRSTDGCTHYVMSHTSLCSDASPPPSLPPTTLPSLLLYYNNSPASHSPAMRADGDKQAQHSHHFIITQPTP